MVEEVIWNGMVGWWLTLWGGEFLCQVNNAHWKLEGIRISNYCSVMTRMALCSVAGSRSRRRRRTAGECWRVSWEWVCWPRDCCSVGTLKCSLSYFALRNRPELFSLRWRLYFHNSSRWSCLDNRRLLLITQWSIKITDTTVVVLRRCMRISKLSIACPTQLSELLDSAGLLCRYWWGKKSGWVGILWLNSWRHTET